MVPVFCLIFLFTCATLLQCEQASNIEKTDTLNNFIRLSSVIKGNYTIMVISTFTEPDSKCRNVSLNGLLTIYAIKQAVAIANNKTQSVKIGIQFDDDCGDLSLTMTSGIKIVSLIETASVCHDKYNQCSNYENFTQSPAAILGTDMSSTTIPLATLMSQQKVPILSPWASSRLLSDAKMYTSFIRVIPSDSMQVQVLLDIMIKFNWSYIFAVGSNDPYGKLALAELEIEAKSKNICIVNTSFVTYPAEEFNDEINKTIDKIKIASNATVVVMFCYFKQLGEFILKRAHRENISRMWLTSEAWYNEAQNKTYKHDVPIKQMHGLLSVSLKFTKIFGLSDYINNEIKTNYLNDVWLQNYLMNEFNCKPNNISINKSILFGDNCSVSVDNVTLNVSELEVTSNWVDAVTVLANGIQYYDKNCYNKSRINAVIDYEKLTYVIKNISSFSNNGNLIRFNNSNDPIPALYTIENLQYDEKNGTLNYVNIGNWTNETNVTNRSIFKITIDNIKWPYWFINDTFKKIPRSKCREDCEKGNVTQMLPNSCCWRCEKCLGFYSYANSTKDFNCSNCTDGYHTENNINCTKTKITWLSYKDPEGIAVIVVSSIGLILILIFGTYLYKFRYLLIEDKPFLHLLTSSLPFCSFLFGYMNVFEPTNNMCTSRNVIFFLLLMVYSSTLLIKTKMAAEYLNKKATSTFKCQLLTLQIASIALMLLVEMIPVFIFIFNNKQSNNVSYGYFIRKICAVGFNVPNLISNFIPLIILILATCCAFRERNLEHHFYEPKFVSFTCIALLVVMIAYLLTFNFVKEELKAIVMTFTLSIFALIYTACLILPKLHVGHERLSQGDSKKRMSKKKVSVRVSTSSSMYQ
ncbi:extracellular calcium-sensing receptor [Hydra vulgaris]|uniref:extracellular calcium-sensing receptor n=1 Tax=Hydra vulgaris TaxID=6087 RepID=UPI001F5EA521|nr:extracellular calcium-sensing receptor-like [Hydra vulgaris]